MPHARILARALALVVLLVMLVVAMTACGSGGPPGAATRDLPKLFACRVLTPEDVARPSNSSKIVDCKQEHTAETFAVGSLPDSFDDADYQDPELGEFAYQTCSEKFMTFLGADDSLVMRTVLSWAWFRPSEDAWDDGARWYRCDVIGGGEQSASFVNLPTTAEGIMLGKPADRWMVCVDGESVNASPKIPCSEPHQWRAVTTIKLGETEDEYPGDRVVEVQTRDFCSDSVGAWLNYPVAYDFGYTWFHEAEWEAGNRRSVCWAKTQS